jgi:DNA invertase Pin-like site-specific DNA recombinase
MSSTNRRWVVYYRVSTDRQGRSGLGLDAQRICVQQFLEAHGGHVRAEFTEIQSGKDDSRPKLADALNLCRLTNATLLIAKLDRLSRNVAFLAKLQEAGTKFVACDVPEANELYIHILSAFAQAERKAISVRTKQALAAAKKRGTVLGNPRLRAGTAETAAHARKVKSDSVRKRNGHLYPVIEQAQASGCNTLRSLADYLNDHDFAPPTRGKWHPNSVRRILVAQRGLSWRHNN